MGETQWKILSQHIKYCAYIIIICICGWTFESRFCITLSCVHGSQQKLCKKIVYAHAWHSTAQRTTFANRWMKINRIISCCYCWQYIASDAAHTLTFRIEVFFSSFSLRSFFKYIISLHLQKDHCRIMDKWHTCVRSVMQTSLWMSRKWNQDKKLRRMGDEARARPREKCAKWKNV